MLEQHAPDGMIFHGYNLKCRAVGLGVEVRVLQKWPGTPVIPMARYKNYTG